MSEAIEDSGAGEARRPSLLYVATISATVRHFLRPYAVRLRSRGWRVAVAARGASGDGALGGSFTEIDDLPLSRSIRDVRGIVRTHRRLSSLLASGHDVVHVHTPIAGFLTRFAASRVPAARRPALVYTAHGFHFHRQGRLVTNLLFLTAERVAGRWTDRLVVINEEDFDAARRYRIVPPERLVRMPGIGLDTATYARDALGPAVIATARASLGVPDGAPLFVAVGELNANKRHADAIRALAALGRRDAHLVVVGDGRARAGLERLAAALGIADRVHLPGFIGEVRPVVAGATALVHPSKREGLSRAVMEALSLEVPVIASTARGNAELVGDSGAVVPIGDVRALAAAMDRIAADPAEREAMGRRGRARMVERYDLAVVVGLHETMYEAVLAERERRPGHGSGPAETLVPDRFSPGDRPS